MNDTLEGSRPRKCCQSVLNTKRILYWVILIAGGLCSLWLQCAVAATATYQANRLPASSFDAHGRSKVKCENLTDGQGKKYLLAHMANATYKIPIDFGPDSCGESGLRLKISWSRANGLSAPLSDYNVSRPFIVLLSAPQWPPRKDSYEVKKMLGIFDQTARTPTKYPGLSELFRNGKPLRLLISNENSPKTPSGNPYVFEVDIRNAGFFDVQVALPGGNSFRINQGEFRKHLYDWDHLFPALVKLLQSFEQRSQQA